VLLPELSDRRVLWTRHDRTRWTGVMAEQFVVELLLLGTATPTRESHWTVIGGIAAEKPGFGGDAFGTPQEAAQLAEDMLVAFAAKRAATVNS
jgi:hypothetical protein